MLARNFQKQKQNKTSESIVQSIHAHIPHILIGMSLPIGCRLWRILEWEKFSASIEVGEQDVLNVIW